MSNFYKMIKVANKALHFVFITGVTKFSRMGVFSTLNNIKDISLFPEFAALTGFTQKELEDNFRPYIKSTAESLQLTERKLLKRIKEYYDGFSFDGETMLYNPQSIIDFFDERSFENFWMESGSKSFVREMLKEKKLRVDKFRRIRRPRSFIREPGEIEKTTPVGFLYQAGYLSLRKDPNSKNFFFLDYPNFEVFSAISKLFLDIKYPSIDESNDAVASLTDHLKAGDVWEIINDFNQLFALISYDDHISVQHLEKSDSVSPDGLKNDPGAKTYPSDDAESEEVRNETKQLYLSESFYRSNLQCLLVGAGIRVTPELHTSFGRSDLDFEVEDGRHYIIELKVVAKSKDAKKASQYALNQIISNGYSRPYQNPILLGLAISFETRNIAACFCVADGLQSELELNQAHRDILKESLVTEETETPPETDDPKRPRP
jgi:hypothetical protein